MSGSRVTVLMYHRLGHGAIPGREVGEDAYCVTPEAFEEHLAAIAGGGTSVVGLAELRRGAGAGPTVCLTFDDGNATDFQAALPALRRRGWSAIFFVVPAWIGTPGYLTWAEARELRREGMTVGAHGYDHTLLATLGDDLVRRQLRDARRAIAAELGEAPLTMSLPGGSGGRRVVQLAREEGFELVATSEPQLARLARGLAPLPRFAVRRGNSAPAIGALARQEGGALWRWRARHAALVALRSALGERFYARLRGRWASESAGRDPGPAA